MPRPPGFIDTEPFTDLLADALRAYGIDLDYATAMCVKARVIAFKRASWEARVQLRAAEDEAMADCKAAGSFTCPSTELPCGVGTACRFSTGPLREFGPDPSALNQTKGTRRIQRPQVGPDGQHGTSVCESLVGAWRDHLADLSGPA